MKIRNVFSLVAAVLGLSLACAATAQTTTQFSEDFTGQVNSTANGWLVFGGACLTAGTTQVTATTPASPTSVSYPTPVPVTNPQYIYGCVIDDVNDILHYYYQQQHIDYGTTQSSDQFLLGGANGFLGSSTTPASVQSPDPAPSTGSGSGALRFTNGYTGGSNSGRGERGAIISANAYPFNQGIQVTFKTVTYGGDNGQGTGADGISFYLLDGCMPVAGAIIPAGCTANIAYGTTAATLTAGNTFPATGAFSPVGSQGGSLSYTCSNANSPYDGLAGGYLGLGIDEYGNFVNPSDNTHSGPGSSPSTIGLRGAGGISWQSLTNAYGVNPNTSSAPYAPYYPASLAQSCSAGTYDSLTNTCGVCSSGTYGNGICTVITAACPVGSTLSTIPLSAGTPCAICPGATYHSATSGGTYPNGYCQVGAGAKSAVLGTNWVAKTTTFSPTSTSAPNTSAAQAAVQKTCQNGTLYNYANAASPQAAGATTLSTLSAANGGNAYNTANLLDYTEIAYSHLTGPVSISNQENVAKPTRALANTLLYNLKITPDGLLSLSYSANGGAYQSVIKNQSVTATNGQLPAAVRYGFAASSGGSSNVHEVMCFKSQPVNQAESSVGVNQRQSAEIQPNGAYAYFSFYDTLDWAGRLTSNQLLIQSGSLVVDQTPNWDASCVLTGSSAPNCASYAPAAEASGSRVILAYGSGIGESFQPPGTTAGGGITAAQLANLDLGDTSSTNTYRLSYLRGDRTNELGNTSPPCPIYAGPPPASTPLTVPCFRPRDSVLGDIIDSSPVWVGPPQFPYTAAWQDKLNTMDPLSENGGTQNYLAFQSTMQTRTNVVYVGANDGMLHGFRAGSFNSSGSFDTSSTAAPNDGQELLAYVPGATLQSALSPAGSAGCPSPIPNPMPVTLSTAQNIHGVTPAAAGPPAVAACVAPSLDYSNQNYGHNFFVDATPGSGDLFYNGNWHTWVVGGMGPGGAAIFALDVTNSGNVTASLPTDYYGFNETNAAQLVIGEWTPANLTCANTTATNASPNPSSCASNLGNTYGTPIIRRLHDGNWAIIFGNGFGSASGDAGIYVMTLGYSTPTAANPSGITPTTYYLSTAPTTTTSGNNGIAYVTSADLDGDHITDYIYAGDLKGNVWRFDLTSSTASNWAVTPGALFTTQAGQPITTAVTVASGSTTAGANTLMIGFGTGQKTQVTNTTPITYQASQQSLYGVWDWNMGEWNALSSTQYASLNTSTATATPPPYSSTLLYTNLQAQSLSYNACAYTVGTTCYGEVTETATPTVCWQGTSGCSSGKYGWYLNLMGSNSLTVGSTTTTTYENIVYSPLVLGTAFVVNSTVPAINSTLQCTTNTDTGFTYAVSVMNGNVVPSFFTQGSAISYHDTQAIGEETNATGTSFPVTTANGQNWLVYQTVNNTPSTLQVNPGANFVGKRLTWVQLR